MRTNIGLSILIALSVGAVPPCASAKLGNPVRPGDLLDESDVAAVVQSDSGCENGLRTLTVIRPIKGNLAQDTSVYVHCQSKFSAGSKRLQIVFLKYGAQAGTFDMLQEDEYVRAVRELSLRPVDADSPERRLGNEMTAVFLLTPDEAIKQVSSGVIRDVPKEYAMLESIYSSQAEMMYYLEPESVQSTLREISSNTALSPLQRLFSAAVLAWHGDVGSLQGVMDLLSTDLSKFGAPPVFQIATALNIARAKNVRGDRSKALAVMGQLMSSPNALIALDACRGIGDFFTDEFGEADKEAQTGRQGAANVNQAIALMMGALSNSDREVRTCAAGAMWRLTGERKPMSMPGPRTDLDAHVAHWAQWARENEAVAGNSRGDQGKVRRKPAD